MHPNCWEPSTSIILLLRHLQYRYVYKEFNYYKKMKGQHVNGPKRLFDICIKLISDNLDIVESFQGFPSIVGEKIFEVSLTSQKIDQLEYVTQAVKLFAEAFCEEFLSSLNITGEHLGANYYHEQIILFTDLVELDMSNCGLGDDHELLNHVSKLYRLERFHLRNNCLTDQGIQKLTLPFRVFGRGPTNLRQMDLSDNTDLSVNCLKYLVPFKCLEEIYLCNCTHIKMNTHKYWEISNTSIANRLPSIETRGWAKGLVENWMKTARDKAKTQRPKRSQFYSRPNIEISDTSTIAHAVSSIPYHSQCRKCFVANRRKDALTAESSKSRPLATTCTIEEDNEIMNSYLVTGIQSIETSKQNTFLSSLSHCEVDHKKYDENKGDNCNTVSSHRAVVMNRQKTQKYSKQSQIVSKQGLIKKPNAFPKEVKQSTLLKFYCSENKETTSVIKQHDTPERSKDKELKANCKHDKIEVTEKENKISSASCIDRRVSLPKTQKNKDYDKETRHNNGPVRKKRKIVIVRPQADDSKPAESGEAFEKKLKTDKIKINQRKGSFLSSLDQWI